MPAAGSTRYGSADRRSCSAMEEAIPDCLVSGYEHLIEGLKPPNADDCTCWRQRSLATRTRSYRGTRGTFPGKSWPHSASRCRRERFRQRLPLRSSYLPRFLHGAGARCLQNVRPSKGTAIGRESMGAKHALIASELPHEPRTHERRAGAAGKGAALDERGRPARQWHEHWARKVAWPWRVKEGGCDAEKQGRFAVSAPGPL